MGTEAALLDLLDEADPEAIAEWVADLKRPPVLITREREPTVLCKAVVEVPDQALARQVLDSHYRAHEGATWDELFEFGPDEYIVRATLLLDGSRLTIEANSEERMVPGPRRARNGHPRAGDPGRREDTPGSGQGPAFQSSRTVPVTGPGQRSRATKPTALKPPAGQELPVPVLRGNRRSCLWRCVSNFRSGSKNDGATNTYPLSVGLLLERRPSTRAGGKRSTGCCRT